MSIFACIMLIAFLIWMCVLLCKEYKFSQEQIEKNSRFKHPNETKYRGPEDEPEWEKYRRHHTS